jgi:hypothetical protein
MFTELKRKLRRVPQKILGAARPALGIGGYVAVNGRDMRAYWDGLDDALATLANPFAYYEELVLRLLRDPVVEFVPCYELLHRPATGRTLVALRHDLDSDPITGVRAARFLARYGICGSFYLLHTAGYYADLHEGVVVRNPMLPRLIRDFIVSGCDLGLHNDALWVFREWGRNGIEALIQELTYVRACGALVRGTVAHNSGPVYGAENYEIFSGRRLWQREVRFGRGYTLPLGRLQESHLGLTYEGTFAVPKRGALEPRAAGAFFADRAAADVRSESWMKRYLLDNPACDWATDYQFWLLGKDQWAAAGGRGADRLFEWNIGLARTLELVGALPKGSRVLIVVHPEYVRA